mgnify:FL=1
MTKKRQTTSSRLLRIAAITVLTATASGVGALADVNLSQENPASKVARRLDADEVQARALDTRTRKGLPSG